LAAGAAAAFPSTRYAALNAMSVRSGVSVLVLDDSTAQPLKNAEFSVAGQKGKTDASGTVKLEKLRLGSSTMSIKKPGFAEYTRPVTLGWGSNPLGEFRLKASGSRYQLKVTEFLSGKPVAKAEASSGEASALSDEKGEITVTIPPAGNDNQKIKVKITADNFRTETIEFDQSQKSPGSVTLVPARKHAFISKRSGEYDVYKIDADGKNEEKVLAGNGSETSETTALAAHPDRNIAALVSNRNGKSTLTLINLEDNKIESIVQSERVQLVEWINDSLIFVSITEGTDSDDSKRHRLIGYDIKAKRQNELAAANYFNDVLAVKDDIYYSPASHKAGSPVGLFKINAEGNVRKTVYDKEVWKLLRSSYENVSASIGQQWYTLNTETDALNPANSAPASLKSRLYTQSPDKTTSVWVDERDGKGTLLAYLGQSEDDTVILAQSGLKNPVRWLNKKYIVYRVNSSQETADFVYNLDGGPPLKIRDVTDTAGTDRWYYY